jgi:pseudaminic acid cytidylyltransferase
MSSIAIIPARGGSKRVPRKNLRLFCGKPIIAYSIEAALSSGLFAEVMVSTDDDEIARLAATLGAKVPVRRSAANADDAASVPAVLEEVLGHYAALGARFETGCCIYPTAPFIGAQALAAGREKLVAGGHDSVFPVTAFTYPIWRGLKQAPDGTVSMLWPEHLNARSQDLPRAYHDAGQWYWFKTDSFLEQKSLFMAKSGCVELPGSAVQDIDNPEDWKLAELKYRSLKP